MKIFNRIALQLLVACVPFAYQAQKNENLISNGSFEVLDGKLKRAGSIETALGWVSPTGVRADLFGPSKFPDINVPLNMYGKETAKDGEHYAGIYGFSYGDKEPRSYIMTKLASPMEAGKKYCVQFHVSLAEASKYSSNQIGINFSRNAFGTDMKTSFIDKTHILHEENKIFNAFYNWEKICGIYEADGQEKYLTIGNFTQNDDVKSERNKKPGDIKVDQILSAYYYIDDVSVVLIDENNKCGCVKKEVEPEYPTIIYHKDVRLNEKMSSKEKIEAQQVYFAFGKKNLGPAGNESLDLIVRLMTENPQMKLEIQGHSSNQEVTIGKTKESIADMDNKRIKEVMTYLTSKGISELRLIASPQQNSVSNPEINETDDKDLKEAKNCYVTFKVR